jgi:hypothetical protein
MTWDEFYVGLVWDSWWPEKVRGRWPRSAPITS